MRCVPSAPSATHRRCLRCVKSSAPSICRHVSTPSLIGPWTTVSRPLKLTGCMTRRFLSRRVDERSGDNAAQCQSSGEHCDDGRKFHRKQQSANHQRSGPSHERTSLLLAEGRREQDRSDEEGRKPQILKRRQADLAAPGKESDKRQCKPDGA